MAANVGMFKLKKPYRFRGEMQVCCIGRYEKQIKDLLGFATIAIIGALVYSNTLHVPWYFDDIPNIVQNQSIRDLGGTFRSIGLPRSVGTLTFALNFHFGALSLPGYHLVNIFIHILTSCTVYLVLKRVVGASYFLPLAGALIFLVHPVQTQAVTYIVQRFSSLCGLFFFLSLYFYIRARELNRSGRAFFSMAHLFVYGLVLLFGIAAILTKQNAVVLPIALLLFDSVYIKSEKENWIKPALYMLPFLLLSVLFGLRELLIPYLAGTGMKEITATAGLVKAPDTSPIIYLFTEFSVMWIYIRLLFIPYGQTLDYAYPLVTTLFNLKSIVALLGLVAMLMTGIGCRQRHKGFLFGIVWFLLALSVESTFIPLDTVFEHRLYIPMFGFAVVLLESVSFFSSKMFVKGALCTIVILFALLAWQRNALWANPMAFHEDNLRKAPNNYRAYISLSKAYIDNARFDDAVRILKKAEGMMPLDAKIYNNLGSVYAKAGDGNSAVNYFKKAIGLDPSYMESYMNLGSIYDELGQGQEALAVFSKAVSISPHDERLYTELGIVYEHLGSYAEAEKMHRRAITELPGFGKAHFNLAISLYKQGRLEEASKEFDTACKLLPLHADALFNSGLLSLELGDAKAAHAKALQLENLDPVRAGELEREIRKLER